MSAALRVHSLWKSYAAGVRGCSVRVLVLRDLSLTVEQGERVLVLGARGSGKSTLLHCISGLREPDAGVIERSPTEAGASLRLIDDLDAAGHIDRALWSDQGAVLSFARSLRPADLGRVDRVLLLRDGRLGAMHISHGRRRVAERSPFGRAAFR